MNTELLWTLALNSLCPQMCPCVILCIRPTLRNSFLANRTLILRTTVRTLNTHNGGSIYHIQLNQRG